jgi:hypothetical protein
MENLERKREETRKKLMIIRIIIEGVGVVKVVVNLGPLQ